MSLEKDIEETLKVGVLDVKFGPRKYICQITNRRVTRETDSIDRLAEQTVSALAVFNSYWEGEKIQYDNVSGAQQYNDIRPLNDEELEYFKEMVAFYKHKKFKESKETRKTSIFVTDDPKSWLDEKYPSIK